jgi:hypothetical protein
VYSHSPIFIAASDISTVLEYELVQKYVNGKFCVREKVSPLERVVSAKLAIVLNAVVVYVLFSTTGIFTVVVPELAIPTVCQ